MSLVPFESNLNIGPYLNFMLEVLALFMFQSHFEIPTHSKPMEVEMRLYKLLLVFFFGPFPIYHLLCFYLFIFIFFFALCSYVHLLVSPLLG